MFRFGVNLDIYICENKCIYIDVQISDNAPIDRCPAVAFG